MRRISITPRMLIVAVLGLSLAACSSPGDESRVQAHFDGPVYSSIEELSAQSDVVLAVRILGVHSRTTEAELRGLDVGGDRKGLPLALYEAKVNKKYKGSSGSQILITRIDLNKVETQDQTGFSAGQDMMLFLRNTGLVRDEMPVFAVVGMDQGRLEIANGRLRAVRKDAGGTNLGDGQTIEEVVARVR